MESLGNVMNELFGDSSDCSDDDQVFQSSKTPFTAAANTISDTRETLNVTSPQTSIGSCRQLCEIRELNGIGGGRGVFAICDIPPGSLIMAEIPICECDISDDDSLIRVLTSILQNPRALLCTQALHPRTLADADNDEIQSSEAVLDQSVIDRICEFMSESIQAKVASCEEIKRIFLTLQHNGFASGLYRYLTMINHNCRPNCIKFTPTHGSLNASEILSTRLILANEEITISYRSDVELSEKSIQEYLFKSHRFHCSCQGCSEMKIRRNLSIPEAYSELKDLFYKEIEEIEKSWENQLEDLERELVWLKTEDSVEALSTCVELSLSSKQLIDQYFEKIDAMASLPEFNGLFSGEANRLRNPTVNQPLRIRSYKAIVNITVALISIIEDLIEKKKSSKKVKVKSRFQKDIDHMMEEAAAEYVLYSLVLLEEQQSLLGNDHPDIATTHLDISEGLSSLSKRFPKKLQSLRVNHGFEWADDSASPSSSLKAVIRDHKIQGNRIKALFDTKKRFGNLASRQLNRAGSVYWGMQQD